MGLIQSLFTGFGKTLSKSKNVVKATSKTAGKTAKVIAREPVATRTLAKTQEAGFFGRTAKSMATSPTIKRVGKIGAYTTAIGGGTYILTTASGKGLENLGYGYRNLTGQRTPQDIAREENELLDDKIGLLDKYGDFLQNQGLSDSPSTREIYDRFVLGDDKKTDDQKAGFSAGTLLLIVGIGTGAYLLLKKKKGSKSGTKR